MIAVTRVSHGFASLVDRMSSSRVNYRAALVVDALGAVAFLVVGLRAPLPVAVRVGAIAFGYAGWGFVEYALHRWLGHGPPSVGRRGHSFHHADDTAPVAAPVFVVLASVTLICAVLALLTGAGIAALIVCGLYGGYNHYALVHHVLHHHEALAARVGLARIERCHRVHHVRHDVNFGVTSTLWDRLFGTYQPELFSSTNRS